VSLAPSSYFFCANAALDDDKMAADETPPMKPRLLVFNVTSIVFYIYGGKRCPKSALWKGQNQRPPGLPAAFLSFRSRNYALSADMISPNSSQVSPLKRCSLTDWIG